MSPSPTPPKRRSTTGSEGLYATNSAGRRATACTDSTGRTGPVGLPSLEQAVDDFAAYLVTLPHEQQRAEMQTYLDAQKDEPEVALLLPQALARYHCAPTVRVWTAEELISATPEVPDAIWPGYVYRGAITELTSKVKLGKSTLMLAASRAISEGQPLLGSPTTQTRVLYCSEERQATVSAAMRRVGLDSGTDFRAVLRHDIGSMGWREFCEWVKGYCADENIGLVVFDTLSDWANLSGEEENQAGAALMALRPVQSIAAAGTACVVIRHERKSGGDVGDSGRGSSAFAGAVDVLVALRVVDSGENQRELQAKGRFDGTPPRVLIELCQDGTYAALGDPKRIRHLQQQRALLDALPSRRADAVTIDELRETAGKIPRSTAQLLVGELLAADVVGSEKGIVPGHPRAFGYWLRGDEQ